MFRVLDHGAELPGHILPSGTLADLGQHSDLPEGGFGWHMIRALAKDVEYRRQNGCNQLSFRLDLG
jgi:serine/threonine-protein kinase RsbW